MRIPVCPTIWSSCPLPPSAPKRSPSVPCTTPRPNPTPRIHPSRRTYRSASGMWCTRQNWGPKKSDSEDIPPFSGDRLCKAPITRRRPPLGSDRRRTAMRAHPSAHSRAPENTLLDPSERPHFPDAPQSHACPGPVQPLPPRPGADRLAPTVQHGRGVQTTRQHPDVSVYDIVAVTPPPPSAAKWHPSGACITPRPNPTPRIHSSRR